MAEPNVFEKILSNYNYLNKSMVEEINLASSHDGLSGNYREEMWMKFFRSIIPMKYAMAQGVIIIDSDKNCSREVDIAVYDEQYTPYVFQYNTLKFIPIEAVAVVIECKSTNLNDQALQAWSDSIEKLKPKVTGIARMVAGYATGITNSTQQRSRPIRILATNFERVKDVTFEELEERLKEVFDFILVKQKGSQNSQFKLIVPNEGNTLGWWGNELNIGEHTSATNSPLGIIPKLQKEEQQKKQKENMEMKIAKNCYEELKFKVDDTDGYRFITNKLKHLKIENNALLTLNLQLNQLIMLINNPMLFPHFAYAKAFKNPQPLAKENTDE
ncbi:DUF6602 domain-containing protein [Paenibacillus campi]|uniref:DUF6602 domain-containing protein n=1 Tax=Paenibacillus campi TaxID=3106031 RepID=UPI002AFF9F3A|nr:DUF6602 domain-containing protein [Paenibacillus sp. SGZ-1014]